MGVTAVWTVWSYIAVISGFHESELTAIAVYQRRVPWQMERKEQIAERDFLMISWTIIKKQWVILLLLLLLL